MGLFFKDNLRLSDLKSEFRKLCLKLHPDKGGDSNIFQQMYQEYEYMLSACDREAKQSKSYNKYDFMADVDLRVWEQAQIFAKLSGVKVEIIGTWIWISGNTTPHNQIFHEHNCKWSKAKFAWYWYAGGVNKNHKVKGHYKDLNVLRDIWGTKEVQSNEEKNETNHKHVN